MHLESYVNNRSRQERLQVLRAWAGTNEGLPLDLAEDLLCLDLSREEQCAIVRAVHSSDNFKLECFMVSQIEGRHQEVAVSALQEWLKRTEHHEWPRMTDIITSSMTPQRVKFSILDAAWQTGGLTLVKGALDSAFEDLSAAFHALLLQRCLQWNFEHPKATKLALNICRQMQGVPFPDSKALASALAYVARFAPDNLMGFALHEGASEIWKEIARSLHLTTLAKTWVLEHATKQLAKGPDKAIAAWPPLWLRHHIEMDLVAAMMTTVGEEAGWEVFAGIPAKTLKTAYEKAFPTGGDAFFASCLASFIPLSSVAPAAERPTSDTKEQTPAESSRRAFFDLAYRGIKIKIPAALAGEFFGQLIDAWQKPSETKLAALAQVARQAPAMFRLCYINTLARFKGIDEAALKLLDFIRTSEEDELKAVVNALSGIETPRATMELVATLTRPNTNLFLQLEICQLLRNRDLAGLQSELRSAIADLSFDPKKMIEEGKWELKEALTALLLPLDIHAASPLPASVATGKTPTGIDSEQIDRELLKQIPHYTAMSSEVRRALRTARFLHNKVNEMSAPGTIDLSPIIDMQYKALELVFREVFEDSSSRIVQQGTLQRKLDVIGYARPIPHQMDDFENFLANLPVVSGIPFFSKFKLRKMLRAICQFRPGKRFTLDGLKAFGLFFLVFSRQTCRYNLQNSFALPFTTDRDLAEFCKDLHVFQDFRNRAVHEGLHPDASGDIDGIWVMTARVIEQAERLKAAVGNRTFNAVRPQGNPIIERKVS